MTSVIGTDFDGITCKNGFYLNVCNVFLLPQHIDKLIETLTNYLEEKELSDDHYVSLTMTSPGGIVTTLSFPGKSKSKLFCNSRQTIIWRKNGTYSSIISRY